MTISPSSRYAFDHPRTYGSWRSQLMHVSVQKFTTTTWPRSWAGPSGSELSHPVAARSEGMCTWAITDSSVPLRLVPRAREPPGHDPGIGRRPEVRGPSDQGSNRGLPGRDGSV